MMSTPASAASPSASSRKRSHRELSHEELWKEFLREDLDGLSGLEGLIAWAREAKADSEARGREEKGQLEEKTLNALIKDCIKRRNRAIAEFQASLK